jgi:putative pyruvate formate lyase activating enzyme
LPAILAAMADCGPLPSVVWKSNFFGTIESLTLLDGLVDVYVADFKFGNDACARRIAGVEGYVSIVTRNLLWAADKGRLLIRHLLLPGHFDCCYRPMVDCMCRTLPRTPLRIMAGYLPRWKASDFQELSRPLEYSVWERAVALAAEQGLTVID